MQPKVVQPKAAPTRAKPTSPTSPVSKSLSAKSQLCKAPSPRMHPQSSTNKPAKLGFGGQPVASPGGLNCIKGVEVRKPDHEVDSVREPADEDATTQGVGPRPSSAPRSRRSGVSPQTIEARPRSAPRKQPESSAADDTSGRLRRASLLPGAVKVIPDGRVPVATSTSQRGALSPRIAPTGKAPQGKASCGSHRLDGRVGQVASSGRQSVCKARPGSVPKGAHSTAKEDTTESTALQSRGASKSSSSVSLHGGDDDVDPQCSQGRSTVPIVSSPPDMLDVYSTTALQVFDSEVIAKSSDYVQPLAKEPTEYPPVNSSSPRSCSLNAFPKDDLANDCKLACPQSEGMDASRDTSMPLSDVWSGDALPVTGNLPVTGTEPVGLFVASPRGENCDAAPLSPIVGVSCSSQEFASNEDCGIILTEGVERNACCDRRTSYGNPEPGEEALVKSPGMVLASIVSQGTINHSCTSLQNDQSGNEEVAKSLDMGPVNVSEEKILSDSRTSPGKVGMEALSQSPGIGRQSIAGCDDRSESIAGCDDKSPPSTQESAISNQPQSSSPVAQQTGRGKPPGKAPPGKAPPGKAPSKAPPPKAPPAKSHSGVDATAFGIKLKPVHWAGLRNVEPGSLWDILPETKINYAELERRFSQQEPKNHPISSPSEKGPQGDTTDQKKRLRILDCQTSQKLGIVFSRLPAPERLAIMLDTLDGFPDCLPAEAVIALNAAISEQRDAIEKLRQLDYQEADIAQLDMPERYLWVLGSVPHCMTKISCGALLVGEARDLTYLADSVKSISSCCQSLRESQTLLKCISVCLSVGNTMNRGTARTGFRAVVLPDSLLKLENIRSAAENEDAQCTFECRGFSLLDFVAQTLAGEGCSSGVDHDLLYGDIAHLHEKVKAAMLVSVDDVEATCKVIQGEAQKVSNSLKIITCNEPIAGMAGRVSKILDDTVATLALATQAKNDLQETQTWSSALKDTNSADWLAKWSRFFELFSNALNKSLRVARKSNTVSEGSASISNDVNIAQHTDFMSASAKDPVEVSESMQPSVPSQGPKTETSNTRGEQVATPQEEYPIGHDASSYYGEQRGNAKLSKLFAPMPPDVPIVEQAISEPALAAIPLNKPCGSVNEARVSTSKPKSSAKKEELPKEFFDEDARVGPDSSAHLAIVTSRRKSSTKKERRATTEVFDEDARIGPGGLVVSKSNLRDAQRQHVNQDRPDKLKGDSNLFSANRASIYLSPRYSFNDKENRS